jgi:hypothetical protein
LEKVKKPGHGEQKTSKNWPISHTSCYVFAQCDKTVKVKKNPKIYLKMGLFSLQENVFVIAQNRLVFSIIKLNGASNFSTCGSDRLL